MLKRVKLNWKVAEVMRGCEGGSAVEWLRVVVVQG
jgi:hypothetical protein